MSAKVLISHFRTWSCLLPAFLFPPFHFTFLKYFKRKYLLPHFYLDSITFPENICMATLSDPVLVFWGFYLWFFFLKHSHFSPKCYFIALAFYHCFCHHSLSVYLNPRNLYQTCFYVHSLKWGGKKLWKKKSHHIIWLLLSLYNSLLVSWPKVWSVVIPYNAQHNAVLIFREAYIINLVMLATTDIFIYLDLSKDLLYFLFLSKGPIILIILIAYISAL